MNSKFFRGVLVLGVGGGFLLFLLVLYSSEPRLPPEPGPWREAEEDVHVEGIHFREWKGDALQWDLDARLARYYYGDEKASFEGVSLRFHPPEGGPALTLHADSVLYGLGDRTLQANGNVWGEGEQGFRFQTESLRYEVEQRGVSSAGKVVLSKGGMTVEGTGMKGSLADQSFRLLSSVHTVFIPVRGAP